MLYCSAQLSSFRFASSFANLLEIYSCIAGLCAFKRGSYDSLHLATDERVRRQSYECTGDVFGADWQYKAYSLQEIGATFPRTVEAYAKGSH